MELVAKQKARSTAGLYVPPSYVPPSYVPPSRSTAVRGAAAGVRRG